MGDTFFVFGIEATPGYSDLDIHASYRWWFWNRRLYNGKSGPPFSTNRPTVAPSFHMV